MDKLTVLVTAVGSPIAHGVLKGLKERDDIHIIGTESRAVTAGNALCDTVYQVPRFKDNVEDYFKTLNDIIEKEHVQALFSCYPPEIDLYEEYKNRLSIPFSLPTSKHYPKLRDKEQAYKWLKDAGLEHVIPTYYAFDTSDELVAIKNKHFKDHSHVIVKDVSGYAASGFAILTDRQHFLKAVQNQKNRVYDINDYIEAVPDTRRIMMEELEAPEYSVDVYVHAGKTVVAVPRDRAGVSSGLVIEGSVVKEDRLIELSTEIAEVFIEDGFINLQFMKEHGEFKLTDINPRFCGSQVMSLGAGVNFPSLFLTYQLTDDRPVPKPIWNTRMYRYRETYFHHFNESK